jgi:hypothetical protein
MFLLKKHIGANVSHISNTLQTLNIQEEQSTWLAQVFNAFVLEVSSSNMTKTIQHPSYI